MHYIGVKRVILGCKIARQRDIVIRPTHELPFLLITIVVEPQP